MPKTSEVLNGITDKIHTYKTRLFDESLSSTDRLLLELLIDLNYLRWESLGEWVNEKDNQ